MRQSTYNFFTDLGEGRGLLTNLLSRTVLHVTNEQRRFLESLSGELSLDALDASEHDFLAALVSGLFVLPDEFDERTFIRESHAAARASKSVKTIVIAPTMRCNMSCHYCFERKTEGALSQQLQALLVERVLDQIGDFEGLHVQWFGGEPLLEMEVIRELTSCLQSVTAANGKSYSAEIITNGVLIDRQVAESFPSLGVSEIQVTLEGSRRLHDKVRFTSGRQSSFAQILEGIELASSHVDINIRVHVTPYSVGSAMELLDVLAAQGLAKRIKRIYFSPLFNYRVADSRLQFRVEPRKFYGSEEFAATQTRLIARAGELGFPTGDPLSVSYGLCVAMLEGTEVFGSSGLISKCYLDTDVKGKAHDSLDGCSSSPAVLGSWAGYQYAADPECAACKFLPVCLGGCPSQRMHQADKGIVCTPIKYNFNERMRLAYGSSIDTEQLRRW